MGFRCRKHGNRLHILKLTQQPVTLLLCCTSSTYGIPYDCYGQQTDTVYLVPRNTQVILVHSTAPRMNFRSEFLRNRGFTKRGALGRYLPDLSSRSLCRCIARQLHLPRYRENKPGNSSNVVCYLSGDLLNNSVKRAARSLYVHKRVVKLN